MRFSDLHNHSRSYLWLKSNERHHRKKGEFHPWTIISPNLRSERNAKGSLQFETFQNDLIAIIESERKAQNPTPCDSDFTKTADVIEAVESLCVRNAENFVRKHYPD
jgi:hypothetical protein